MKIKSLSLIIMLALCLTVGGVYATWSYAEEDVSAATDTTALSIAASTSSGAAGTITVNADNLQINIVNGGNYKTELEVTGSVTVTFAPTPETAPSLLPTSFTWALSASDAALAAKHGSENIITSVTNTEKAITLDAGNSYTATITAAEIQNLITLNEITLETSAEHAEYKAVVDALTDAFTITVAPAASN